MSSHPARFLVLMFAVAACSKDVPHEKPADADASVADVTVADAEAPGVDRSDAALDGSAATDGAAPEDAASDAGDGLVNGRRPRTNLDFESAQRVQTDDSRVLQDVVGVRQSDFYVFTGKAGVFYEMKTDSTDFSPDLVMTLFDADKHPIAENDSGSLWPGDAIDARLVVRLAHDGDYFVRLEDRTTPAGFFMQSFALLYYHLQVRELGADATGATHDASSAPNQVRFSHDDKSGYDYSTVVGTYDAHGKDVFSIAGLHENALIGHVLSTAIVTPDRTGHFAVTDQDKHVLAQIDLGARQENIQPPITDGAYQLTIDGADGPSDSAYAVDLVLLPDNPREQNDLTNGVLANAETLAMSGNSYRRGFILATQPAADIDYFKFQVSQDQYISVICEAESAGSGVRDLRAELRNDADKLLTAASETATDKLQIDNLQVMLSGTYYLRLSSKTPKSDAAEPWTRCVVTVSS
jgi:hypothetical protein